MELIINLKWDPVTTLTESKLIDFVATLINGDTTEYKGHFKNGEMLMKYLWSIYVGCTEDYNSKKGESYVGKQVEFDPIKGLKIYSVPVLITEEKHILHLKHTLGRVGRKHFIVTRNEWVSNEEYCAFYGSSGGIWKNELCEYKRGDFIETLRQTVYDMENGDNPEIYQWTNVPRKYQLEKLSQNDLEFKSFAKKEIYPLVNEYWKTIKSTNFDLIKNHFIKIADVTEKYKKEFGIKSV